MLTPWMLRDEFWRVCNVHLGNEQPLEGEPLDKPLDFRHWMMTSHIYSACAYFENEGGHFETDMTAKIKHFNMLCEEAGRSRADGPQEFRRTLRITVCFLEPYSFVEKWLNPTTGGLVRRNIIAGISPFFELTKL